MWAPWGCLCCYYWGFCVILQRSLDCPVPLHEPGQAAGASGSRTQFSRWTGWAKHSACIKHICRFDRADLVSVPHYMNPAPWPHFISEAKLLTVNHNYVVIIWLPQKVKGNWELECWDYTPQSSLSQADSGGISIQADALWVHAGGQK